MIRERSWNCQEDENLLLSLSRVLRIDTLLSNSRFGGPDELLLLSGGPVTEFSRYSMLMGPSRTRVIARQPSRTFLPARDDDASPLQGEVPLGPSPPALELEVQEWGDTGWQTVSHHLGENLQTALSTLDGLQPESCNNQYPVSPGAWAGSLAYDLVQWTQPWRLKHLPQEGTPLLILHRVDRWLIHDGFSSTLHLLTFEGDEWGEMVEDLLSVLPMPINLPSEEVPEVSNSSNESSSHSDDEHAEVVSCVKEAISAGRLYQLNFGRRWHGGIQEDPWQTMMRLSQNNPAPMSAWVSSPDLGVCLCSCSPELLLSTSDGRISTRPIKGTRPRGRDAEEDAGLRSELLSDQKEMAEHRMLVDLERNDIGIVSKPGTVVQSRFQIEAYTQVQHLVSEVTGELRAEESVWSALQAMFPGGSITGCPKTATIAAIDELEKEPRSFWTGSIGYCDPRNGRSMWNILIRTLEAWEKSGDWVATIQAGGGLVMASDPKMEVEEAKWKARALREGVGWINSGIERTKSQSEHSIHPVQLRGSRTVTSEMTGVIEHWRSALSIPGQKSRILFVDNLDSFSWNIMHAFCMLGADVIHCSGREDDPDDLEEIMDAVRPSHIVLGPGPDRPSSAPLTMRIAQRSLSGRLPPVLGICLGHQALGEAAGMELVRCPAGALHGVPVDIHHDGSGHFEGFQNPLSMCRYNSLTLLDSDTPFIVTARDEHGQIMAMQHGELPISGLQFHPESCGSILGDKILQCFLEQPARREVEERDSGRR